MVRWTKRRLFLLFKVILIKGQLVRQLIKQWPADDSVLIGSDKRLPYNSVLEVTMTTEEIKDYCDQWKILEKLIQPFGHQKEKTILIYDLSDFRDGQVWRKKAWEFSYWGVTAIWDGPRLCTFHKEDMKLR